MRSKTTRLDYEKLSTGTVCLQRILRTGSLPSSAYLVQYLVQYEYTIPFHFGPMRTGKN
jgi:hypothetical protein